MEVQCLLLLLLLREIAAMTHVWCQQVLVCAEQCCNDCHQNHCVSSPGGADGVVVGTR
jgi:hypothetical protein